VSVDKLQTIAENLRTQDNRATEAPIFAVQQRRRIYGFDPSYGENVVWVHVDGVEADAYEHAEFEAEYNKSGEQPSDWRRTFYCDKWEFVTACFTEQGCKDYIAINGHNLKGPRIYAYGSYRNEEWTAVRDHLISKEEC